jgi:hypothetical protein
VVEGLAPRVDALTGLTANEALHQSDSYVCPTLGPAVDCRSTIYYLPGAGGQLSTGLGQGLMRLGFDVAGRETRDEFRRLALTIS